MLFMEYMWAEIGLQITQVILKWLLPVRQPRHIMTNYEY